jgi:hypothetical protein
LLSFPPMIRHPGAAIPRIPAHAHAASGWNNSFGHNLSLMDSSSSAGTISLPDCRIHRHRATPRRDELPNPLQASASR